MDHLFRNSRIAQVAQPISKSIRAPSVIPTHQVIYTPKGSAIRSDFGLKSTLPKQIGYSHIAFNDIDNYKNMPDVEKYTGKMHNRLKYQEIGVAVKPNAHHALFPSTPSVAQGRSDLEVMTELFNLSMNCSPQELATILAKNKGIHRRFQQWLAENHPEALLERRVGTDTKSLVKKFLNENAAHIAKKEASLRDYVKSGSARVTQARYNDKPCVQGNAGFSYLQPGRLTNSPNGVRYGAIAPGRIVGQREAAIGGVVASVQDTSIRQQTNYTQHQGGKTTRQFNMPFRIGGVSLSSNGAVNVSASGVEAGTWMKSSVLEGHRYRASPRVNDTRQSDQDLNTLFNILRV